ncbi:hypothetical protein AB0K52_20525 [Glycomyces sp. NPDC049804]|uniref:hypothetical protein n=1 Tax=Glycomyces sp. NPDC049804 TaxID=3154363 RepID=UPI003446DB73
MQLHPTPLPPLRPISSRGPQWVLWFHLIACLVVWPVVFGTVFIATFVAIAIVANDPGGPLFWPLAWGVSAIAYGLVVGIPLTIFGRSRRWYLRLVPAVIAAAPFIWLGILAAQGTMPVTGAGVLWSLPSIATIAVSVLVQTARGWRTPERNPRN